MKCLYSGCSKEISKEEENEEGFDGFCSYDCSCMDACGGLGGIYGNPASYKMI